MNDGYNGRNLVVENMTSSHGYYPWNPWNNILFFRLVFLSR